MKQEDNKTIFFKPFDYYYYLHYNSYLEDCNLNSNEFSYEDYKNTDYYGGEIKTFYSYGKTIDFLKWEIFSSINGYVRLKEYFLNTDEIEIYFKKKYNNCFFFDTKCDGRSKHIFQKDGVNFEDFKKVILPNFKMDFIQEINTSPQKNSDYIFFNWDFFLGINDISRPNTIYMGFTEVYDTEVSNPEIICSILENLFVSSAYCPDAILKGLAFDNNPRFNTTISNYFNIEGFQTLYYRIKKDWACYELKEKKKDFIEILSYFESLNRPICKIYRNNKFVPINSIFNENYK